MTAMKSVVLTSLVTLMMAAALTSDLNAWRVQQDYGRGLNLLRRTLHAVGHILKFYGKYVGQMNVDAGVGTAIVEGQLTALLNNYVRFLDTDADVFVHIVPLIERLQLDARLLNKKVVTHVRSNYPDTYKNIGKVMDVNIWESYIPKRSTNPVLANDHLPALSGEMMEESMSDQCLGQLTGSSYLNATRCTISDLCWDLMTKPGFSRYSLTHQVLFFFIGSRVGCDAVMAKKAGEDPRKIVDHLCANVRKEMDYIEATDFPRESHDLFMEQAALCGMWGYEDLFSFYWLQKILGWQRPTGCFGNIADYHQYHTGLPADWETDEELLIRVKRSRNLESARFKREDAVMDDGCSAHQTAVAAANLVLYIRFVLEYLHSLGGPI